MQSKSASGSASVTGRYKVYGAIRNQYQQPMIHVWVRAFDKDIRNEQPLGETTSDQSGNYEIRYTKEQFASGDKLAADLILRVYDGNNSLLKESPVYYNAAVSLEVDIDLSGLPYRGLSAYEKVVGTITPFVTGLPLGQLTENDKVQDISFLTNKAVLPQDQVEKIAMSSRYEQTTKIPAYAWYGMLQEKLPGDLVSGVIINSPSADFETRLSTTFDALLQENINTLMNALQQAINDNNIPFSATEQLSSIKEMLLEQIRSYANAHPADGTPSALYQKLLLGGLDATEINTFISAYSTQTGTPNDFWNSILSSLQPSGKGGTVQAVFQAGQLTGEHMPLTAHLIRSGKPASPDDLKQFAGHTQQDWENLLRQESITPPATSRGNGPDEKMKHYSATLEKNFTRQFPTSAFSARLAKDQSGKIPGKQAVADFLLNQPQFDLQHTRVGKFLNDHPGSVPKEQVAPVTDQLRRIQRIFKLSPDYNTTQTLLADNIHSAQQVYEMGPERFAKAYNDKLGSKETKKIFQKAKQAHAQSIALLGNLKSMSDASALNVFPDYGQIIKDSGMTIEIPNLQTLFGNNDYCECDDCNSVYGAAAYLTDMLHYLDMRASTLNCSPGVNASVKDILLRRRPAIGDIDLDCDNTNTEIPYIDIACEIMEDFISAPVITIAAALLAKLVPGKIDASLLAQIAGGFNASGQENTAILLTANAQISESYSSRRLQNDNTCITETHWVIRDELVVLKATDLGATGIEIRLLHQTLLDTNTVSANPEYININAYDNFLKIAKRPYNLPFDLFEMEGELYLQKLGISKSNLIDAFRKNHEPLPHPTATDLAVAYAYLGVNQSEQTLIFQADTANQTTYWGPMATGTSVKVDLFESASGLDYAQILDLLTLQFINPLGDSMIQHDDLTCDTDKQAITNLSAIKFDAIHRFLRLWRKTSLAMEELDAIIMSPAIGKGVIDPPLAWELQHFLQILGNYSFSAFQLLAFYQDLDTRTSGSLYFQLFQNRAVTNPLNPDFSLASVNSGATVISAADLATIQAALQIAPGDLQLLLAAIQHKLGLANLSDVTLTLHNLSFIYRYSQFAQALTLSVADLLVSLDLINIQPLYDLVTVVDPATTDQFLQKYNTLKTSGFGVEDLNYILRQQDPAGDMIPDNSLVTANLTELQNGLLQLQIGTQPVPDPKGVLLSKWLSDPILNWDSAALSKLLDLLGTVNDAEYTQKIDNNHFFLLNLRVAYAVPNVTTYLGALPVDLTNLPPGTPDSIGSQLSYDSNQKLLKWTGYMSAADQGAINLLPGVNAAFTAAVGLLFNAAQKTSSVNSNVFFVNDPADFNTLKGMVDGLPSGNSTQSLAARFNFFLAIASPPYRLMQQQNQVQSELVKWFKTDKQAIGALVNNNPAIYTAFLDGGFISKANLLTSANYPNAFSQYLLNAKICFIVNKLKLTATDLNFLLPAPAPVNALSLLALPLVAIAGPVTSFVNFEVLVNILKFEQFHPTVITDPTLGASVSVYTILQDGMNAAPLATIESDLVQLTGWSASDLDKLINAPDYLSVTVPGDITDINVLLQLHNCFSILSELGVSADDAVNWCNPSLSFDDSAKIKQTLKARYGDSDWLGVTQPLQDQLREKKRDMLITYLLANPGLDPQSPAWQTSDDLYGYFLLDVEMCACQPTSRIVQATNSVQLFVQRCFLALEPYIAVDTTLDSNWTQWQWMKYYRLWQANREVFLWPENWIEPDLLPKEIQSSFFQDLQNDLKQNEVTEVNAENAFQNYLEKLDGVARLEVKGMWYDDPSQTLYVFARTYGGDPKVYYFRQLIQNRRWTPWQPVNLDIKSDHIIPVVFNDRVYLFWAVINQKTDDPSDSDLTIPMTNSSGTYDPPARPNKYWQIQLAFSEYRNGKWSPKKISNSDDTGMIDKLYQSSYPLEPSFLFTPLDVPNVDFSNLFDATGKPKDPATLIATLLQDVDQALSQNGNLYINCYYQDSGYYNYIWSFELDPCRGYPVLAFEEALIDPLLFDNSSLSNMLDQEDSGNVLSLSSSPILKKTPDSFDNLVPLQMGFIDRLINIFYQLVHYSQGIKGQERMPVTLGTFMPYFFEDGHRTYYVAPEFGDDGGFEFFYSDLEDLLLAYLEQNQATIKQILSTIPQGSRIFLLHHYYNFYHPLVCYFIRQLFNGGIDGLMSRDTQLKNDVAYDPNPAKFDFNNYYSPTARVYSDALQPVTYPNGVVDAKPGYPKDDVDFNYQSGYGLYNWELFFHAPLMIAEQLSVNQQFDDADRWFRYIFNPSDTSSYPSPDKYWNTKPFFINVNDKYNQQQIGNIMLGIDSADQALVKDVADWANNPFQPHYIAEYRTVAYQLTTVMKYLDHLIRWGDYFFSQDTMESVSEATQLYILASQILGPQPQIIPPAYALPVDNYYQLEAKPLDAFSNAMVDIENLLPLQEITGYTGVTPAPGLPTLQTLYFCLPMNQNLVGPTGYWNTVADRLYKIRHCLNIQGVFAPLALFAPPIDPGMLVRAAAEGLDLSSILSDMNNPVPFYRFAIMLQKAIEFCNEVKSLGAGLLSALEKADAEALALLRSGHEISLLNAVSLIKQKQIDDAQSSLDNLNAQQALITIRSKYYQGLISGGWNAWELTAFSLNTASTVLDAAIALGYTLAGGLKFVPGFVAGASGFGGSPQAVIEIGPGQFGDAAEIAVKTISSIATALEKGAALASTAATFNRRSDEWQFQLDLATQELAQIAIQIKGAQIKLDITNQDLQNQQLQISNAQAEDDFMHSKYTNEDLYNWMISQISTTYFQSYQQAYSVAKQAEQCLRYELGLSDSSYINFGYWDSLKKGLLSGEQLMYDIRRMEIGYCNTNQREYELTKHISLAQLDPVALLKLKQGGDCWVNLPEELFDMDYPGHYMRRIKTVGITIPCIVGPYTTISCKLTMTKNSVRTSGNSTGAGAYPRKMTNGIPADDPRFRDAIAVVQSIATSNAQNDGGLFELNFHDERYLPFEYGGAISLWRLELPAAVQQFDHNSISDVIVHLKYTSRDGGDALKGDATASLTTRIDQMLVSTKDQGLMRLFSTRHEFPTAWYQFLHPANPADPQVLTLNLTQDRFPFFAQAKTITINTVELAADSTVAPLKLTLSPSPVGPNPVSLTADGIYGSLVHVSAAYNAGNKPPVVLTITNSSGSPLTEDQVKDLVVILHYSIA